MCVCDVNSFADSTAAVDSCRQLELTVGGVVLSWFEVNPIVTLEPPGGALTKHRNGK